jgi:hypothetical protein
MRMSCQFGRNRTDADAQADPNKEERLVRASPSNLI